MLATDAITAAASWRPQEFGDRRASDVDDPIVEPLWTGPRVLAFAGPGRTSLTDVEGEVVDHHGDLPAALVEASGGATVLLEAVLTKEPLQRPEDLAVRDGLAVPKVSRAATQLIIGDRGRRTDRLVDRVEEAKQRIADSPFVEVALVTVDLIWL